MEYIKINQFSGIVPIERKFICKHCSTPVEVVEKKDKRTVFCSKTCEKNYWRKKSKEKIKNNLGVRNYSPRDFAIKLWREKWEARNG